MYPKNTASPRPVFATVVKASDGSAITTGVAAKYCTGIGTGGQDAGSGTCQYEGNGQWSYTPTQAETNVDAFGIQFYHADAVGTGPTVSVVTTPINATTGLPSVDIGGISGDTTAADNCELMFDGTGYAGGTTPLSVNVTKWYGTEVTINVVTNKPEVDVFSISSSATAANNCELMFDGTGYAGGTTKLGVSMVQINAHSIAGTSNQVADGFESFFNVATPGQTVAATGISANVTKWYGTDVTLDVVTNKPDINVFSISSDATAADNCELMFDGTGYAGGTTKLGVDAVAISGDSTAADRLETMLDGTGGNALTATFTGNLTGSVASVTGAVGSVTGAVGSVTGAVGSVTGNVGGNVTGSVASVVGNVGGNVTGSVASVVGAVGSVTGNVGGNVTGTIGGLTAAALKDFFDTDSATTYASAVAGSVVKEIADNAGGSALTEGGIADAVWNEVLSGHAGAGSAGEALAAAGTAGDPWLTALPGSYGDGTAGQIIGDMPLTLDDTLSDIHTDITTVIDRIGAFLGSGTNTILGFFRALFRSDLSAPSDVGGTFDPATDSQEAQAATLDTIDNYIDTEVAAIKAKTDNLPASPAAVGSAMTLTADYDAAKTAASQTSVNTLTGYVDTEVAAILAAVDTEIGTLTSNLATVDGIVDTIAATVAKLETTLVVDGAVYQFTANALELAPSGGSGTADWTSGEKEQIRSALGVDGTKTTATGGQLQTLAGYVDTEVASILAAVDTEIGTLTTNLATVDGIVDAIKLKTDLIPASPAAVGSAMALTADYDAAKTAATQTSVNTLTTYVDTEVAAILAAVDTEVAAIKAKTDLIPASPAAVGSAMTLTAGERNSIADAVLVRDVDQVEATAPVDSIAAMILAMFHSNTEDNEGYWTIYRTDDATEFKQKAISTDEDPDPITGISG